MSTVFCVIGYNHDGQVFKGVFSNAELAKTLADILQEDDDKYLNWNTYCVEEWELDKEIDL